MEILCYCGYCGHLQAFLIPQLFQNLLEMAKNLFFFFQKFSLDSDSQVLLEVLIEKYAKKHGLKYSDNDSRTSKPQINASGRYKEAQVVIND
jgi:hypothetical protein